ncbi:ribokinase (plasmid) [Chloroflexota bacterium]|nr:ribokinase [Chloroflexota bacterium]
MTSPKITVIGSYVVGMTMRAPRFAVVGESLIGTDFDMGPGGKGSNQAIGAARLGAQVNLLEKIGKDVFAQEAMNFYASEGIDTQYIIQDPDSYTGVAFITLNPAGENLIVVDVGANEELSPEDVDAFQPVIADSDVVMTVLEIKAETAARAMALGKAAGAITILNCAPARPLPESIYKDVDVLTPNETELKILLGLAPDEPGNVIDLARAIQKRGVGSVVVTRGEAGALVVHPDGEVTEVPGIKVDVVDTTGAGDAFNAALGTALGEGRSLVEAARFAVVAGGLCCTKLGVIPALPYREGVEVRLKT